MRIKQLVAISLIALGQCSVSFTASADEASLKKSLENAYPKYKVQSITKTPFDGLYEVFMGGHIIYTDEKLSYLIVEGRLVDPKSKKDLTAERLEDLNRIDFSTLPLEQAIKVVKGNGSRKLVVFSDVDCPYCKQLERKELSNITDVTIYTFLYPIDQLHPDAANKSKSIWCATDRVKAWNDWILKDQLPASTGKCEVPIEKVAELGKKIGIVGTPALIFSDGKRVSGAIPHIDIERYLQAASGKSSAK